MSDVSEEPDSLKCEYAKHLSSVAINNVNLLSGLSPAPFVFPVLVYYSHQLRSLHSCLSEIRNICNSSDCKCECKCKSDPPCNENTICLCECTKGTEGATSNGCCICICKKTDESCKCVCICICKNGETCCCKSGETHTCGKSLAKVDVSKFGFKPSDVINHLFYIRCSLRSLTNNTINSNSGNLGVVELDKQVVSVYSMSNLNDYWVLINRMVESAKKIDQILQLVPSPDGCQCILGLEKSSKTTIDLDNKYVHKIMEEMTKENSLDNSLKLDKIKRLVQNDIKDNHLCLCMVVKYLLYPKIINISRGIFGTDLDTLSTISRKYVKYRLSKGLAVDLIQFFIVCVELLYKVSMYILLKFKYSWKAELGKVEIICFCCYCQDPNYSSVVSTLLVVSSVVQNIWTMDPETIRIAIVSVSRLIAEFEKITQDNKSICNNGIHMLLVSKECQTSLPPGKSCCCWCVTCYNLAIMCVSLCLQFKLNKAIRGKDNCEDWKKICTVDDCTCNSQCTLPNQGLCCLLQSAFYSIVSTSKPGGCKTLEQVLKECGEKCGGNGCCAKLKEKLKFGLCKVLLLGCESTCASAAAAGTVKVKCLFFNYSDGCTSVAMVVFCKCAQPSKCCLTELVENFKSKLADNLCQDSKCVCDELKAVCEQICGENCAEECVCTKLKTEITKICGDNSDCLCKEIKKFFENLCTEKNCQCKNKGCCRCVCCKVLGASIRLLVRACTQNVLHPYKRIVLELIRYGNKNGEIIRPITKSIINGTVNMVYLVKNSYSSHSIGLDTNISVQIKNWGYDTRYEHKVTTQNGFSFHQYLLRSSYRTSYPKKRISGYPGVL